MQLGGGGRGQYGSRARDEGHILDWIYLFQAGVLEQTEAGDAKDGVENINHVARAVREATQLGILVVCCC